MKQQKSAVIIRGSYKGLDPIYASMAHNAKEKHYTVLEFENGLLKNRNSVPFSDKNDIDRYTKYDTFKGTVFVDSRTDSKLLPLTVGRHCVNADLGMFRRAKSDEEIEALESLQAHTLNMFNDIKSEHKFRGAIEKKEGLQSALQKTETKGFTQYRGGFKDTLGRTIELTHISPKTKSWEERLGRVYEGMDKVKSKMKVGASMDTLTDIFKGCLDPTQDTMYGPILQHGGYRRVEDDIPLEKLEAYDVLILGCVCGSASDKNDMALVYRSAHTIPPEINFRGSNVGMEPIAIANDIKENPTEFYKSVDECINKYGVKYEDTINGLMDSITLNKNANITYDTFINNHYRNMHYRAISTPPIKPQHNNTQPVYNTPQPVYNTPQTEHRHMDLDNNAEMLRFMSL